jgi:hypothetical protein
MADADADARIRVATRTHELQRNFDINTFDEALGPAEYRRWRTHLIHVATSAGPDFVAALTHPGDIPPPAD